MSTPTVPCDFAPRAPPARTRTWYAMGDPQTTFERFTEVLATHGLLDTDGRVRDEMGLVSIGDHYDFGGTDDVAEVGQHGERILRFLAAHPRDQVVILLGNHDTVRVQEFAYVTDALFTEARAMALKIAALGPEDEQEREFQKSKFHEAYPQIPTPELASRDFCAFATSQRTLMQELLLAGRVKLAASGRTEDGTPVLLNHAGLTKRELTFFPDVAVKPSALADALNRYLDDAVATVAPAWQAGALAKLDLAPVHVAGRSGEEGGGLLYHRPGIPQTERDRAWAKAAEKSGPRRYHPSELPLGLAQMCGHTGHKKLRNELGEWVQPDALAVERGGLRTLVWTGTTGTYRMNLHPARTGEATLYLIDAEMNFTEPAKYPLVRLAHVDAP